MQQAIVALHRHRLSHDGAIAARRLITLSSFVGHRRANRRPHQPVVPFTVPELIRSPTNPTGWK